MIVGQTDSRLPRTVPSLPQMCLAAIAATLLLGSDKDVQGFAVPLPQVLMQSHKAGTYQKATTQPKLLMLPDRPVNEM